MEESLFFWDPKRTYSGKITDSKEHKLFKEASNRLGVQEITIVFFFWNPKFPRRASVGSHGDGSKDGRRRVCVTSRNPVATGIWGEFC